ncbi:MAG: hypothetical protein ACLU97_00060 [Dorea sp.]
MKIQKTIFYILMFLPLPVTLIFPFVIIMFGLFMLVISKDSAKQDKNNEKICILEEKPAIWWDFFHGSRIPYHIDLLFHKRLCLLLVVNRHFDTFSFY